MNCQMANVPMRSVEDMESANRMGLANASRDGPEMIAPDDRWGELKFDENLPENSYNKFAPRNVPIALDSTAFAMKAIAFVNPVGPESIAIGNFQISKHQRNTVTMIVPGMANALMDNAIVDRTGLGPSVRK